MFQYTHEVIINSLTRDGLDRFQPSAGVLQILRSGVYKFEHVVDGKIYKTAGHEGKVSTLELDFTDVSAFAEDGTYRLTIFTKMPNKFLGEYANANWYEFGKPLMVEFECIGSMTSEIVAKKVLSALKLSLPENNQWLKITHNGDPVTLEGITKVTVATKDPYMIFSGTELEYYEPTACDSCVGYYEKKDLSKNVSVENGYEPFATAAWITENLRFPSYPNVRYASPNSDEIPTPGAIYNMYSFAYDVVRKGLGGLSVVGQKTESVTRHIYYVRQDLAAQFEAAIEEAFGYNVVVEDHTTQILGAGTVANDGVAVILKAEVYPYSDKVTFTWSGEYEGSPIPGSDGGSDEVVLDPSTGAITVKSTVEAGAKIKVTATPSDSSYAPETRELTVIEG